MSTTPSIPRRRQKNLLYMNPNPQGVVPKFTSKFRGAGGANCMAAFGT
jgi:hypothetical protein